MIRSIEILESSIAPAFTATAAGTVLTLVGDAGSHYLLIDDANTDGVVAPNGVDIAGARFSKLTKIVIVNTAGGNDIIRIDFDDAPKAFDSIGVEFERGAGNKFFIAVNIGKARVLLNGGTGNDTLLGGGHVSVISGGDGDDPIYAIGGKLTAHGGAGNDFICGYSAGYLKAVGSSGSDTIDVYNAARATLISGAGNDSPLGLDGNDLLEPGPGNDTVDGVRGYATVIRGPGFPSASSIEQFVNS